MHSTYSDGSGTVEDIIEAGNETDVDFLILTDHNSLDARDDGYEGWHDDVLLIVGDEVSSRQGHCLAFGTRETVNHRQTLHGILADIEKAGGDAYIAHPFGRYRPLLALRDHSWQDWTADRVTGLEIWSYSFDWASGFHYLKFPRYYRNPDACLRGPRPETLAKWDELCRDRRVVGLGGVDAHARKYPLLPFVVFPYPHAFTSVRTHVLCENPLRRDAGADIANILSAVAEGRCWFSFDRLADGAGTRFETDTGLVMGEEAVFDGPCELRCTLPADADVTVVRDGRPFAEDRTREVTVRADGPGVYRVEARIDGRPWLYTNPIYLRRPQTGTITT